VPAAVEVVELALGDGVVDVDGREQQRSLFGHLVEAVYTGRRLLAHAAPLGGDVVEEPGVLTVNTLEERLDHRFFVTAGFPVDPVGAVLQFNALVDKKRRISTVINDQIGALASGKGYRVEGHLPVLLERLPLPRKDGYPRRIGNGTTLLGSSNDDRRGGVVLSREDIAARPAYIGAKLNEGLDEDRRLDRHVKASGDSYACKRFLRSIFLPGRHESGHLELCHRQFFPSPLREGKIFHVVVKASGHATLFGWFHIVLLLLISFAIYRVFPVTPATSKKNPAIGRCGAIAGLRCRPYPGAHVGTVRSVFETLGK
jgi:hypothetical protein